MHRPSGCPSCAEPLEEGDRFCGVCGYAVTAPPPGPSTDRPTVPLPTAPPGTGPSSYGAPEPAPGWGSVAAAAPTLVGDPADWAVPGPAAAPANVPAAVPAPAPAETRHDRPDSALPEGAPWAHDDAPQPPAEDRPARYDVPGAAPTPPGSGADGPAPAPAGPPQGNGNGGRTCVACRAGHVDTDGYCEHCGHAQPRERDHLEEELGSVAAVSDRGLRHHRNEDAFAVSATALPDGSAATVAVVCDGVSSASRPDEASAAAAGAANEALLDALPRGTHPQEAMHEAILAAAAAVNALAPEVPGAQNAPACTLVGAVVSGGLLTIGWVGDSRAYWVPDDRAALPRRLTEDDSWAAQMVAAGLMGEAEAYADARAHAITGWLGADAYDLEPHTAIFKPDHPGVVVVCTDGLWNYAESAREMAQVLPADATGRPLHAAQVLVGHALDGGGHDNVTVALLPFAAAPEAEPETEGRPEAPDRA